MSKSQRILLSVALTVLTIGGTYLWAGKFSENRADEPCPGVFEPFDVDCNWGVWLLGIFLAVFLLKRLWRGRIFPDESSGSGVA